MTIKALAGGYQQEGMQKEALKCIIKMFFPKSTNENHRERICFTRSLGKYKTQSPQCSVFGHSWPPHMVLVGAAGR